MTLKRLLEFLYTGNYDSNSHRNEVTSVSGPPAPQSDCNGSMLRHVQVCAIADYYDIPSLANLAHSKIKSASSSGCDAEALVGATKESLRATNDEALQEIIATLVVQNLDQLIAIDRLEDVMGDFGAKVLRMKVEALRTELRAKATLLAKSVARENETGEREKRAAARSNHMAENICLTVKRLRETKTCGNQHCAAQFNGHIEQFGSIDDPTFTIMCSKCPWGYRV